MFAGFTKETFFTFYFPYHCINEHLVAINRTLGSCELKFLVFNLFKNGRTNNQCRRNHKN